jgi:hypothetical protein
MLGQEEEADRQGQGQDPPAAIPIAMYIRN